MMDWTSIHPCGPLSMNRSIHASVHPSLHAADEGHVNEAVAAARGAFSAWSTLSGAKRAEYLEAIAKAIEKRKQAL